MYCRILFFSVIVLLSCNRTPNATYLSSKEVVNKNSYALGFEIENIDAKIRLIKVFNPWEGAKGIEYKYLLCDSGSTIPSHLKKIPVIHTPVKRVICLSTTHIALLSFIDEVKSIVGVSGPNYISDSLTHKRIKEGKILDIGFDQALNYELIVSLKPDLVFAYGIQGETAGQYKKLEELGIQVILNGEYLENSPLGKFEWVKFMASFFNKTELATKKFNAIELEYQDLAKKCNNLSKPAILTGLPWKGAWYVPGGDSYAARTISDAGGQYLWNDNNQRESLPLNFEKVIERANQANIWINTGNANSLTEILNEDPRLSNINSFKNKEVYNNNAKMNDSGGNDFWESGITNPHLILKDLIKIFHPEVLPNHSLVYYKKLH